MNNLVTYKIPESQLSQAGNTMGLKPNRLANNLGIRETTESVNLDKGWDNVIPTLLEPYNFSGVIALFQDDSLLLTNIVTGEEDCLLCGEEEGNLKIIPMSQVDIIQLLASYLGETEETPKIKQELTGDALISLLFIADSIKRAKLENILDPLKVDFVITEDNMKAGFENLVELGDLRWMSSFLAELRWESKAINFSRAIEELADLNIIQIQNGKIEIAESGYQFFEELLKRKTIIGIRSIFYHEDILNYLAMGFMRTENCLWFLDIEDNACIMSLNYEQLNGMIGAMIAPGDVPPVKTTDTENFQEVEEKVNAPRFCSGCGSKLGDNAKFCKTCGKKVVR